jgi:hypothetical protein
LATFISLRLKGHFPLVFEQLQKVCDFEGFAKGEACIGNSPFTTFVVARDYNCRPHIDGDDYGLGFILWVEEGKYLYIYFYC